MITLRSDSDAARSARVILENAIQKNLDNTQRVIEMVENTQIVDYIAKGSALRFEPVDAGVAIAGLDADGSDYTLHDNALGQVSEKAALPLAFARTLLGNGDWGAELLADNFQRIFSHGNGTKYMLRSVGHQVRGFLSNKYKRLDSRPIVDAFISRCKELGAVPIDGYALDTKISIQVLRPEIFEPLPGEPIAIGMQFATSDFGNGSLTLSPFFKRVACLNGAIGQALLKQVHVGGKVDDIAYSQETLQLETKTMASKIRDLTAYTFEQEHVDAVMASIKDAAATELDSKTIGGMLKGKLLKGEIDAAIEAFNSADIVNLPAGQNRYRLSNAISWISQAAEIAPARRLELDRYAGSLVGPMTARPAVEV